MRTEPAEADMRYPTHPRFLDEVSAPAVPVPAGSWDTATHVYGPERDFPFHSGPKRFLPPTDADVGALTVMHATLGISRGVLVQATSYLRDHRALVAALGELGPDYVGVALVMPDTTEAELDRLGKAGVVGARFNLVPWLMEPIPFDDLTVLLRRISERGWTAALHVDATTLHEHEAFFETIQATVCIDHLGHMRSPDPTGVEAAAMLRLLERDNWWIRLSNADRLSSQSHGFDDLSEVISMFAEAAPDRSLWGTDWPHVNYFHREQMVDDGTLVDLLTRSTTPEQRHAILVDNPRRFYGVS